MAGLPMWVVFGACSDRAPRPAGGLPPTTSVSTFDAALPSATDLGAGFEQVPVSPALDGRCSPAIDGWTHRAVRGFVANAAQERIEVQVLRYNDARSAFRELAEAQAASSCRPGRLGEAAGQAKLVVIEGAQAAFGIGVTDQLGSAGVTVAVVGHTVVVVQSTLHHGASTAEPAGSQRTAARVVARLR